MNSPRPKERNEERPDTSDVHKGPLNCVSPHPVCLTLAGTSSLVAGLSVGVAGRILLPLPAPDLTKLAAAGAFSLL